MDLDQEESSSAHRTVDDENGLIELDPDELNRNHDQLVALTEESTQEKVEDNDNAQDQLNKQDMKISLSIL